MRECRCSMEEYGTKECRFSMTEWGVRECRFSGSKQARVIVDLAEWIGRCENADLAARTGR